MRRLIIKMLEIGFLDEIFVNMKQNICVYVEEGRHANKLLLGKFKMVISQGVKDDFKVLESSSPPPQ